MVDLTKERRISIDAKRNQDLDMEEFDRLLDVTNGLHAFLRKRSVRLTINSETGQIVISGKRNISRPFT